MFRKMSDEGAAAVFVFIWGAFLWIAVMGDLDGKSNIGWWLFLIDTAVQATILYYDWKMDKVEKERNRLRKQFREVTADYVRYIQEHSTKLEESSKPVIIDIKSAKNRLINKRKVG